MLKPYLLLLRPKHWVKNVLVVAPVFFAQSLVWNDISRVIIAALLFSLMASSIYIINDAIDAKSDRRHPEKKNRPIASGIVPVNRAILIALLLAGISIAASLFVSQRLSAVLAVYLLINLLYSFRLKHVVVLDVMILATGFVLRVIAGGVAVSIPISHWIILCTFFGAIFLSLGKRQSEVLLLKDSSHGHRKVLSYYTRDFLQQLIAVTAGMTVMSYSLYTIDPRVIAQFGTDALVYTVPFVVYGVFRYFYLLYGKESGGDPVKIFTRDLPMVAASALWMITFVLITLYV